MSAKTLTGAHIIVYINGKLYSRCSAFSWNSQTVHTPIYGIDSPEPFELASGQTKVSGTMSVYRLVGDAGAQGAGMIQKYEDVPLGKYFNITLLDRSTDLIVFQARFCALSSESWNIAAKGIITGQLAFEAIEWSNEMRPLKHN
jgi:hypothetical protein